MGIHGLLKELGPPPRVSLAKLSSDHYISTGRPIRIAIDIAIWLFQIQSGKGGSNPALRTFYYRLLRLLTLNIHPLFVFDGPNKPLFKRNKQVGGGRVKVATVPEFLAKQLLKHFGFPWHIAPGEAEAECALLQREGVVDAVLSEDVDALMFGSGLTLRNWSSENSTKSPTHVSVYREQETKERSRGLDREGMTLVALMSGGDYLPEGIPGCGPKVACDAARAGFGKDLCALGRRDSAGLRLWKERLEHQIRTNEAKYFSRKNSGFTMPEGFPKMEVLGFYTNPCVSTPENVQRLKSEIQWDLPIDFQELRSFAADAFDWRCKGGAKKFIKNLAPAMLVRELRIRGESSDSETRSDPEVQETAEKALVRAIHGKRNHATVDGELEYRISFTPSSLVPINLEDEEEDDDFLPAGGEVASEDEDGFAELPPSSTPADSDAASETAPASPSKKKRTFKPFDPAQPEKIWVLRTFLQIGCPMLVEESEASFRDPKEFLKQRRKAKAAGGKGGDGNIHAPAKGKRGAKKAKGTGGTGDGMQEIALMAYARVTKTASDATFGSERRPLGESSSQGNSQPKACDHGGEDVVKAVSGFKLPSTQALDAFLGASTSSSQPSKTRLSGEGVVDLDFTPRATKVAARPFAPFVAASQPAIGAATALKARQSKAAKATKSNAKAQEKNAKAGPRTPSKGRKRPSAELQSPSPAMSQRSILSYYSPSPRRNLRDQPEKLSPEYVSLLSSSPTKGTPKPLPRQGEVLSSISPPNLRHTFVRSPSPTKADEALEPLDLFSPGKLPDTVTKRRKKGPLKRHQTAPVLGADDDLPSMLSPYSRALSPGGTLGDEHGTGLVDAMDLPGSPSPLRRQWALDEETEGGGGFLLEDEDAEVGDAGLLSPRLLFGRKSSEAESRPVTREAAGSTEPTSSYPTPPTDGAADDSPPPPVSKEKPRTKASKPKPTSHSMPVRRSPRQTAPVPKPSSISQAPKTAQATKKKAILLRQSLEGAWKEVDAETLDLSGDGSGWAASKGKAKLAAYRKSGVEVLDLTGA